MPDWRLRQVVYNLQHQKSPHPDTHRGATILLLRAELWTFLRQCHKLQKPHEDTHGWVHCRLNLWLVTVFSSVLSIAARQNLTETSHLCPGEKPYVCTVPGCQKRFTEYSSLYKHHVVHTPCKPYNCNHCGKTYKQISTLAMHKRTAHNDTEPIEEEQEAYFEPPAGQCTCHCVYYDKYGSCLKRESVINSCFCIVQVYLRKLLSFHVIDIYIWDHV